MDQLVNVISSDYRSPRRFTSGLLFLPRNVHKPDTLDVRSDRGNDPFNIHADEQRSERATNTRVPFRSPSFSFAFFAAFVAGPQFIFTQFQTRGIDEITKVTRCESPEEEEEKKKRIKIKNRGKGKLLTRTDTRVEFDNATRKRIYLH